MRSLSTTKALDVLPPSKAVIINSDSRLTCSGSS